MRISHFFIDRPIFASVVSVVFIILGRRRVHAAAGRPISGNRAAHHQRDRAVSRRQRRSRGLDRGRSDRGADQRRREHALPVLELDRGWPLHHRGHLRSRHQSRHRAGAGAEPRRDRAAAPACRRAPGRCHRDQELARPDDGRAPLFGRQVARHPLRLQLRDARDQGPARAHRRCGLDHRVRQPRLCDAGLARPRPAAVAWD